MLKASCHCGAIRIEIESAPQSLTECNCSICRRLGALWAYYRPAQIHIIAPNDATFAYSWGDNKLKFHQCKICGCTTHWQSNDVKLDRMAINARLLEEGWSGIPVRKFDGAQSWKYIEEDDESRITHALGGYSHLSYVYFGTNDLQRAITFYDAVFTPLGIKRCFMDDPEWDKLSAGWGIYEDDGRGELAFWISLPFNKQPASVGNGSMVAFRAQSWQQVDDFHAAALAHGGTSEGAPGLRLHYSPDFYAAYIRDPDGNKIAAICRGFESRVR